MANPTYDDAWGQVVAAIEGCTNGLTIDTDAHAKVKSLFKAAFERRLSVRDTWASDKDAVLNAACQLGTVAAAIANVRHAPRVSQGDLTQAAKVIADNCTLGVAEEGRWCSL